MLANVKTALVDGNVVYYDASGNEIATLDAPNRLLQVSIGDVHNQRFRTAIAAVNAGATLLPAIAGYKYRLIECLAIAIGGAAAVGTTVDILGTQAAASVKLVAYAQASLVQSAVLKAGGAGAAVLADGASYVSCDSGTALTINKTGSAFTTATFIDVIVTYSIEKG